MVCKKWSYTTRCPVAIRHFLVRSSFGVEVSRAKGQGDAFKPFHFSQQRKENKKAVLAWPSDSMLRYPVLIFQSHKTQGLNDFLLQLDYFDFHADLPH